MARYEGETKLSAEEVLQRAERYFGSQGLGLTRRERGIGNAVWEGGGGSISVTAIASDRGSQVEAASQDWDRAAEEFIRRLPRRSRLFS